VIVQVEGLRHDFHRGVAVIPVLDELSLSVEPGGFVAIMGASGSGKSTLLHILGCLLKPVGGSYRLNGVEVAGLDEGKLAGFRSRCIGQVFQMFHLLDELDVSQNVALPFLYRRISDAETRIRVDRAIEAVGLMHRRGHRPAELSGGEMQRAAIARALAQEPELILADEPTGNLDEDNSRGILELLQRLNAQGQTVIMVTHDREVAAYARRQLVLRQGVLWDA